MMKTPFLDDLRDPDPYKRPIFGLRDKARRLIWGVVHATLFRPTPNPLFNWRCFLLRLFGARLGNDNHIYPKARIWAPWLLETEDVVCIADGAEVYNPGGVYLAHHTVISQDAYLCGATHDYNSPDFDYIKKPIRTGPYVWICARAVVLPGTSCGSGSVLGAAGVATRDLEAWTVYAGNPARAVRKRERFHDE